MDILKNRRPILGLALGSGGAKGMAHLGAIKAFEEEGIEFDVVAGTSIGSIVGALYAKGYSAIDMLSLKDELLRTDANSLLMLTIGGGGLLSMIKKFVADATFSDLKKPFRAIATDIIEGVEVVMGSGELSTALASSSAVPPIFGAIRRDGKTLMDGAFLNYVPADVTKSLGAEKVISVNLGKGYDTNQSIKRALDEVYPDNRVPLADRSWQCYRYSDFVIEPDLTAFGSMAINALDKMYEIGYETTKANMDKIKNAIERR